MYKQLYSEQLQRILMFNMGNILLMTLLNAILLRFVSKHMEH